MPVTDIASQTCSVARAIAVVGDAWTLMILRELFLGSHRYDALRTHTGMSPHLLSLRLRGLEQSGVIERRAYQQRPVRHEYRLTDKGLDLWGVMSALRSWGDRWERHGEAVPVRVRHRACGQPAGWKVVCASCDAPIGPREVEVELSPAARKARREQAERSGGLQTRTPG